MSKKRRRRKKEKREKRIHTLEFSVMICMLRLQGIGGRGSSQTISASKEIIKISTSVPALVPMPL